MVVFSALIPEPNSTAAGTRMIQLLSLFREMDYEIHLLYTSWEGDFSSSLKGELFTPKRIDLNDSSIDALLLELDPQIVLYDRFHLEEQFGWRVKEVIPNALNVLDTEDLHFLRSARKEAYEKGLPLDNKALQNDLFKREMASILRSDLSLIISEYEYSLLTEQFGLDPSLFYYLPIFAQIEEQNPSFNEREDFLFIGNFLHAPNWETAKILKKQWPKIRERLPNTKLHLYGAYPSEKVFQLHNEKEGLLVHGRAENLKEVFHRARVQLSPIPYGAGIKGKLLDSMRFGLPSITSEIGAEGMHLEGKWNGTITQNSEEFIEKSTQLYLNENLWNQSQQMGYAIIETKFRKEIFEKKFYYTIEDLLANLEGHRTKNFMQSILSHHTLQSTKYLSRWIEEKNKKTNE